MRFLFLVVALSIAAAAPVAAQPAAEAATPGRLAQLKAKFLKDCPAQLSVSPQGSRHSDAKRKAFCGCLWTHLLRVDRNEAKDFLVNKQLVGSMGEKMYIAERDCMAKTNMWPTNPP